MSRKKRPDKVDSVLKQVVVLRSLKEKVLKRYHDQNMHVGFDKMYYTLERKFFWPNMYVDVYLWIKSCMLWHVDHLALPEVNGYKYVLVAVDSFSLYSVLMLARTTSAVETARLLYDNGFMVYYCKSILSDRSSRFTSKLLKELCRLLNIRQIRTSSGHPVTNSRCEAYNRNILNSLRTHCSGCKNWPSLLLSIAFSFRTTILSSVGLSPYRIVLGLNQKCL